MATAMENCEVNTLNLNFEKPLEETPVEELLEFISKKISVSFLLPVVWLTLIKWKKLKEMGVGARAWEDLGIQGWVETKMGKLADAIGRDERYKRVKVGLERELGESTARRTTQLANQICRAALMSKGVEEGNGEWRLVVGSREWVGESREVEASASLALQSRAQSRHGAIIDVIQRSGQRSRKPNVTNSLQILTALHRVLRHEFCDSRTNLQTLVAATWTLDEAEAEGILLKKDEERRRAVFASMLVGWVGETTTEVSDQGESGSSGMGRETDGERKVNAGEQGMVETSSEGKEEGREVRGITGRIREREEERTRSFAKIQKLLDESRLEGGGRVSEAIFNARWNEYRQGPRSPPEEEQVSPGEGENDVTETEQEEGLQQ
jgi:hypothetical protein